MLPARLRRKLRLPVCVLTTAALMVAGLVAAVPAQAVSPDLVVSQVYGGGGNANATYTHDFVEIFNRGSSDASLSGMSVQYASATGTGALGGNTGQLTELPAVNVKAGQYVLVQEASTAAVGTALPTPDVTDATPIAMAAGAGKVALVTGTTGLGCNGANLACDAAQTARIVDLVGYGTGASGATFYEGTGPAPTISSILSDVRKTHGCQDTDDNASDFETTIPAPRNTATTLTPCGTTPSDSAPSVSTTTPANGATGVARTTSPTVTFGEAVSASGAFSLTCSISGDHQLDVSGGSTTFTLDPAADLAFSETCTVTVVAANVTDSDTQDPPDNMAADYSFSFTTADPPPALVKVHDVQGAAHISPVTTKQAQVEAVVTAVKNNGFWVEEETADIDADAATSEGVFVFTSSAPTVSVGDLVAASGTVVEFRPGGATGLGLTTTEISNPGLSISIVSTGNPLPVPTVVGEGGRMPPGEVIEDDATNVETNGAFDPAQDGIDFYESLEGMRLQVNDAVVTGPTNSFGETWVVGDNGEYASQRTGRGGVVVREGDFNPERIQLDPAITGVDVPAVNVGATFTAPIVGVLDYNFNNFELVPTVAPIVATDDLQREVTGDAGTDQLSVANFNVENLAATNAQSKFDDLADLVVENLKAPDLLVLEEIQDNNGATNNGVVDATQTLDKLVAAIGAAGGPSYGYRQINPVDGRDGGEPGGNIRVGFMFRTDRGLAFVDRPGGGSTTSTTVVDGADGPELSASPGRIDPENTAWSSSRKPLAGEFTYNGHKLFVIGNHFNSKGGDQPLFGRFQPPNLLSEVQRNLQAGVVKGFVDSIQAKDPDALVVVGGDLNDFEFSNPVEKLTSDGKLTSLITTLPADERYSYVFEGNSQTLDHIVASPPLVDGAEFDVVHVNAEFADQSSDHDPSVALFDLPDAAPSLTDVEAGPAVSCGEQSQIAFTVSDPSLGDQVDATISWGDGTESELTDVDGEVVANHSYDSAGTYEVTIEITDGSSTVSDQTELVLDYTVVGGGLLSPVDGSSVQNGSTTPVRVVLQDCDGSLPTDLAPTLTVTRGATTVAGGTLKFTDGQYVLAFKTIRLSGRGTYTYTVTVPDTGQTVSSTVTLR